MQVLTFQRIVGCRSSFVNVTLLLHQFRPLSNGRHAEVRLASALRAKGKAGVILLNECIPSPPLLNMPDAFLRVDCTCEPFCSHITAKSY